MDRTYILSLFRPREAFRDFVLSYGVHKVTYRPGFQRGVVIMAKLLVDAGVPDGRVEIVEAGGPASATPSKSFSRARATGTS